MDYVVVLLAAATALVVLVDSRLRDPYFAFYEILPGMGIAESAISGDRAMRAAIIRRFGCGLLLGIALAAIGADEPVDAIAAGAVVTGLLLWPVLVHGLPRGQLKSDWLLGVVYAAVLAAYIGSVLLGQSFFVLAADRDLVGWARDEALGLVVTAVLISTAFGIFDRWLPSAVRRDDAV